MATKCNLILDSCSDLPHELVERDGIELIEFPYVLSDGEHQDDMFKSISAHDFYESMRKGEEPTTAQVPVSVYHDYFLRAIESGVPTLFLSFTSGLSSSFDVATMVYEQLMEEHPGAELYILDTLQASVAEGFLVYEVIQQWERGLSAKELYDWTSEARFYVNDRFMVEDLDTLHRGGRIPASVAYAGGKLDVKPMLTIAVDGTLSVVGVARGRKKGMRQMTEFTLDTMPAEGADRLVYIGDADCPKDADRLQEMIQKEDDSIMFIRSSIGPVIGSHVGPGMLAVVMWGPDRRENLSMSDRITKKVKGEEQK